jgi:5'-nucleotidase
LVNDDGADAPGLWALFDRIESIADPVVLAPTYEQSARSQAITIRRPMALAEIERRGRKVGYRLDGTPADCVKLALASLYRDQIALVVSGINWGANAGHNILYSGTVGAALEAAIYGLPAIAVSLHDGDRSPAYFDVAAQIACRLALNVLAHGLPRGVILNVNVPNLPLHEIAGAAVTRQGQETFVDLFEIRHLDDGTLSCTNFGGERLASRAGDHPLDDLALKDNMISITPLHFDLTGCEAFEMLSGRMANLFISDFGLRIAE